MTLEEASALLKELEGKFFPEEPPENKDENKPDEAGPDSD
jgi:hypothetical protein